MSRKHGSFNVRVKQTDGTIKKHTVNSLSQHDISNGWRMILPNKKLITVTHKKEDGTIVNLRKTNESFFKINLSQLPPHLFNKLIPVYRKGHLIHYKVSDKCYTYLVQETPIDSHILKLLKYCNLYENGYVIYKEDELEEIKESLAILNENEIKGWVAIKSNRLFGSL